MWVVQSKIILELMPTKAQKAQKRAEREKKRKAEAKRKKLAVRHNAQPAVAKLAVARRQSASPGASSPGASSDEECCKIAFNYSCVSDESPRDGLLAQLVRYFRSWKPQFEEDSNDNDTSSVGEPLVSLAESLQSQKRLLETDCFVAGPLPCGYKQFYLDASVWDQLWQSLGYKRELQNGQMFFNLIGHNGDSANMHVTASVTCWRIKSGDRVNLIAPMSAHVSDSLHPTANIHITVRCAPKEGEDPGYGARRIWRYFLVWCAESNDVRVCDARRDGLGTGKLTWRAVKATIAVHDQVASLNNKALKTVANELSEQLRKGQFVCRTLKGSRYKRDNPESRLILTRSAKN